MLTIIYLNLYLVYIKIGKYYIPIFIIYRYFKVFKLMFL